MDFKTAATIAKEQNMFLTTDTWFNGAVTAAKKLPGKPVFMIAFHYVKGAWMMGDKELPKEYHNHYNWRVYAREQLVFNGILVN